MAPPPPILTTTDNKCYGKSITGCTYSVNGDYKCGGQAGPGFIDGAAIIMGQPYMGQGPAKACNSQSQCDKCNMKK